MLSVSGSLWPAGGRSATHRRRLCQRGQGQLKPGAAAGARARLTARLAFTLAPRPLVGAARGRRDRCLPPAHRRQLASHGHCHGLPHPAPRRFEVAHASSRLTAAPAAASASPSNTTASGAGYRAAPVNTANCPTAAWTSTTFRPTTSAIPPAATPAAMHPQSGGARAVHISLDATSLIPFGGHVRLRPGRLGHGGPRDGWNGSWLRHRTRKPWPARWQQLFEHARPAIGRGGLPGGEGGAVRLDRWWRRRCRGRACASRGADGPITLDQQVRSVWSPRCCLQAAGVKMPRTHALQFSPRAIHMMHTVRFAPPSLNQAWVFLVVFSTRGPANQCGTRCVCSHAAFIALLLCAQHVHERRCTSGL
mmetsp:Transcript_15478/g.33597  ORF Transcript_15478/g.33597 Transcript_15478/m.33597 type:complete len:364 (+) Transcript_15478:457-1548(+)